MVVSWWSLGTSVLFSGFLVTFAYVLFRYVAAGWIGYTIAAVFGGIALLSLRHIGGKLGSCPRCDMTIETHAPREGYLCPSCSTFLETYRGQLVASPNDRVARRLFRFGVEYDGELELPDCCCVCLDKTTRHVPIRILDQPVDLPYCAEHGRGALARPQSRHIRFRSLGYATRVREANHGRFVGDELPRDSTASERSFGFWAGLVFSAAAAGSYYGLAAFDGDYEIVPKGIKGLVLWLLIKLIGRLWVTSVLAAIAAMCFGMFIGSFKPRRRSPPLVIARTSD